MECHYIEETTEDWVLKQTGLEQTKICTVEEVNLMGNIRQKISSLGSSLMSFLSLRHLDISRNNISSLEGLQFCQELESINIYYNNVSVMSELLKLARNPKLHTIDVRLNPICVMSTEYRLLLVHALTSLKILDNVEVTEKDRMLSLKYHSSDQATQLTGYLGEGVAANDIRLHKGRVEDIPDLRSYNSIPSSPSSISRKSSISSCDSYIKSLRPPLTVLQPSRDAYDAFAIHGTFTPNPKSGKRIVEKENGSGITSSPLNNIYSADVKLAEDNKKLREKYKEYKDKYNKVLAERISKESYLKLQEDYYRSLKKNEELEEVYKTSSEQVTALKQHINDLTHQHNTLKQELAIKDQVNEVDKQIKEVCSEMQENMKIEQVKHSEQIEEYSTKYEDLAKVFTETLSKMEKRYQDDALKQAQSHKKQSEEMHQNFANLQKILETSKLFETFVDQK